MIDASGKQHERTQKTIGGPRPQPLPSRPRAATTRQTATDNYDDLRAKRRNVFKRALKGLTLRSSNDLGKIEDMLEQILEDVEGLRAGQYVLDDPGRAMPSSSSPPPSSHAQAPDVPRGGWMPRNSANRIDAVHEEDDEEDRYLSRGNVGSTPAPIPRGYNNNGGGGGAAAPRSMMMMDAGYNRYKSSNIIPKISRWSKTTGDNIRNTIQSSGWKEQQQQQQQPSSFYYSPDESDYSRYQHRMGAFYEPGDVADDDVDNHHDRPPSPLVPSQISEVPKYQAHRNNLNLVHPQPRQGSSGRYQRQLESQVAHDLNAGGASPVEDQQQQQPTATRIQRGRLSPLSDGGFSSASSATPTPTPPLPSSRLNRKVRDSGPLIPPERSSNGAGGGGSRTAKYPGRIGISTVR